LKNLVVGSENVGAKTMGTAHGLVVSKEMQIKARFGSVVTRQICQIMEKLAILVLGQFKLFQANFDYFWMKCSTIFMTKSKFCRLEKEN
jgi:hypothetical protein